MLSRRHLRVKVLQALYAYFQSGNLKIDQGEQQLILSVNKLYELFIYQLSFLVELQRYAERRQEDNKLKHLPTPDDLNPNMRFVKNSVLTGLNNNRDFLRKEARYKINWSQDQEMVRKFYNSLRETEAYEKYMSSASCTFDDDRKLLMYIVEHLFSEFELLEFFYEEKSIYFVDDYHLVSYLLLNFFKFLKENDLETAELPAILKTENEEDNEDLEYLKQLFKKTIFHSQEWEQIIGNATSNWELERIAVMDMIILKMALTELVEFNSIPIKVTLNEYIDISKYFSTAKSKVFVNGILDKLIVDFKADGRIKKIGRGLME